VLTASAMGGLRWGLTQVSPPHIARPTSATRNSIYPILGFSRPTFYSFSIRSSGVFYGLPFFPLYVCITLLMPISYFGFLDCVSGVLSGLHSVLVKAMPEAAQCRCIGLEPSEDSLPFWEGLSDPLSSLPSFELRNIHPPKEDTIFRTLSGFHCCIMAMEATKWHGDWTIASA
jgi:hypothetical protein